MAANSFGGVLGLLVLWFGALVGPIAIPMLLGMLPWFRRSGPSAAILSWASGLIVFALTKYLFAGQIARLNKDWVATVTVAGPVLVAFVVFVVVGWLHPWRDEKSDELVDALGVEYLPEEEKVPAHV
jgi:SSS family solute:Na+ symporter